MFMSGLALLVACMEVKEAEGENLMKSNSNLKTPQYLQTSHISRDKCRSIHLNLGQISSEPQ